jgi:hypothetical protein
MIILSKDDTYTDLYKKYLIEKCKFDRQIKLDVPRTLRNYDYFKDKYIQDKLFNVLHVVACDNPIIGYLQGMNCIAGYFLMKYKDNEIETFKTMSQILKNDKYGLKGLFIDEFPQLFLAIYQVESLTKKHLSDIFKHLKKIKLNTLTWLAPCILTLFTKNLYSINIKNFDIFIDFFLKDGWIIIIKFILLILEKSKDYIIGKTYEETLLYLNDGMWTNVEFYDKELDKAFSNSKITDDVLFKLQVEHVKNLSAIDPEERRRNNKSIGLIICSLLSSIFTIVMTG